LTNHHYKLYLADLRRVLNRHDPIGLIGLGAPENEYDPERSVIASRLRFCKTPDEVPDMVHGVFEEWFGRTTAGARKKYAQLADELWKIKSEHFSDAST